MLAIAPHVLYPALAAVKACKAGTLSNNNLNFPVNKIHIQVCDLSYKETLGCMHTQICFLLEVSLDNLLKIFTSKHLLTV